jgi:hypothetical protein
MMLNVICSFASIVCWGSVGFFAAGAFDEGPKINRQKLFVATTFLVAAILLMLAGFRA